MHTVDPIISEQCDVELVHPGRVDRVQAARPDEDSLGRMVEIFRACSGGTRLRLLLDVLVLRRFNTLPLAFLTTAGERAMGILRVGHQEKWTAFRFRLLEERFGVLVI